MKDLISALARRLDSYKVKRRLRPHFDEFQRLNQQLDRTRRFAGKTDF